MKRSVPVKFQLVVPVLTGSGRRKNGVDGGSSVDQSKVCERETGHFLPDHFLDPKELKRSLTKPTG